MNNLLHKELTDVVLKAYFEVYNELGHGFLEKVYRNAMYFELISQGLEVEIHQKIIVHYKGKKVGDYIADMIVNKTVILELKANSILVKDNVLQLTNYLRATPIEVGILLNFGAKPEIKRIIFTNDRKKLSH